jgi:hypothetical protein
MIFDIQSLPKEERLILLCLRGHRSDREMDELLRMFDELDHSRLLGIAQSNKVERPVAEALVRELGGEAAGVQWREIAVRNERRVAFMEEIAASLFDGLRAASVRGALFEAAGVLYSSDLPQAAFGSGDFDVLVEERGLDVAEKLLADLGLEPEDRNGRVKGQRREFKGTTPDGEDFWIDVGSKPFERSRIPLRYPDPTERWLDRAVPSRKNRKIMVLKAEDLLAQVAVHTSLHYYVLAPGIRLFIDIDRLVRDNDVSWSNCWAETQKLHFSVRAAFSLLLAVEVLGTPASVPKHILFLTDPVRRSLFRWAISRHGLFVTSRAHLQLFERALLTALMVDWK